MSTPEEMSPDQARVFATRIAFDRLAERDRSTLELQQALEKRRVPAEVIEVVLAQLQQQGLLDDQRFAFAWVDQRQRGKGLARSALARELKAKGISESTIALALDSIDTDAERARAHELVRKRMRSVARLEPSVQKRRLTAFLLRKGYPAHVSFEVVAHELDADFEFERLAFGDATVEAP